METIPSLLWRRMRAGPDQPLLRSTAGDWLFAEARAQISGVAQRLYSLGVAWGAPVVILTDDPRQQVTYELATLCLGGIVVDFPDGAPDGAALAKTLEQHRVHLLLLNQQAQYTALKPHLEALYDLAHVFGLKAIADLPTLQPAQADEPWLANQIAELELEQAAWLNGHTGEAWTHAMVREVQRALPLHAADRRVHCLPPDSRLQRLALYRGEGGTLTDPDRLADTLLYEQPTALLATPSALETWWADIRTELGPAGWMLLRWGLAASRSTDQRRRVWLQRQIAEVVVLQPARERLGGALQRVVSEPASTSAIAQRFAGLGVTFSGLT